MLFFPFFLYSILPRVEQPRNVRCRKSLVCFLGGIIVESAICHTLDMQGVRLHGLRRRLPINKKRSQKVRKKKTRENAHSIRKPTTVRTRTNNNTCLDSRIALECHSYVFVQQLFVILSHGFLSSGIVHTSIFILYQVKGSGEGWRAVGEHP